MDPKEKPQAHSLYINSLPNTYGLDIDVMVEAKGKELAILPYLKKSINEKVRIVHRPMAELA